MNDQEIIIDQKLYVQYKNCLKSLFQTQANHTNNPTFWETDIVLWTLTTLTIHKTH